MAKKNNPTNSKPYERSSKDERSNHSRNGNYRGRQGRRDSVRDNSGSVSFNGNDPSWYKLNDQVAHDIASFSFGTATGTALTLSAPNAIGAQAALTTAAPGTYSIYTIPAIGEAVSETSPINVAMNALFRNLRKGNTGSQVYDAPDVMMYLIALDSVYAWIATLIRLYGLSRTYTYFNRYFADGVTLAQGFNPSILTNLAWLRGYINQTIVKVNQFAAPVSINFFKRHYWMYSNAWRDGETTKAQLYMYVPAALYKYNELNGAGQCVLTDVMASIDQANGVQPRAALTDIDIVSITNALLDPLLKSQDCQIISGDIVKYWGDQLFQLAMISEDWQSNPEYNEEVLNQIHNITYCGSGLLKANSLSAQYGYDSATISQLTGINAGYLWCRPYFKSANGSTYNKIVDFEKIVSPTPDHVLVATRGTVICTAEGADSTNDNYLCTPVAFGSELPLFHVTGTFDPNISTPYFAFYYEPERTGRGNANLVSMYARLSAFHARPLYYQTDATAPHSLLNVFGELENYRVFSRTDLYTIHNGAILAMFALKDTLDK